jgi:ABC-2 type transport system permease protein
VFLPMLPMFVIAMLLIPALLPDWGLAPPPSVAAFVMWVACFAGAVLLSARFTTLMIVTLMWTIACDGVSMIVASLATMFVGLVIPLALFPNGRSRCSPLRSPVCSIFHRACSPATSADQAVWVVAHQLAWSTAFVALGRWLLSRGVRRLVVQGG